MRFLVRVYSPEKRDEVCFGERERRDREREEEM